MTTSSMASALYWSLHVVITAAFTATAAMYMPQCTVPTVAVITVLGASGYEL